MTTNPESPTPRRRSLRRRLLFFALAGCFGLSFAVIGIELLLRVYDPLPHPLADLRWFYEVDGEGRLQTCAGWQGSQWIEGRRVPIQMNAMGLRGEEVGPRREGERRVLVLGDSFVFGQGVDGDQTIPAHLQRLLRAAGRDVTVGNAGIAGTGPREWSHTLQRFRGQFEPDLVVAVVFLGNDVLDTLQEPLTVVSGWLLTSDYAKVARESWRFRLRVASRLWEKVETALTGANVFQQARGGLIGPGIDLGDALFLDREPVGDAEATFWREVEARLGEQFDAFAAASRELPSFVVLLPARSVVITDYAQLLESRGLDVRAHERGRGHARIRRWLEARGFTVVDLAEPLLASPDRASLYLQLDGHLNERGCEQVARWLLPELERRLR